MIFVTGDCHGEFSKLSNTNWPVSTYLTKDDYVIVTGDCGLIFHPTQTPDEIWWTKWLTGKSWNILYVDGNHENHTKLNALPQEEKFGGRVGKVADNIYHLRRGEIYEIEGKKFLTFGGATSTDKAYRRDGISWWREEVPSYSDMDNCIASMEKHNYRVDYIVAHTCPQFLAPVIAGKMGYVPIEDSTQKMLDHIVSACRFEHYFCGHWHEDVSYGKYHFLYNSIVNVDVLTENFNNENVD
jgi:hypothetical protein